MTFRSRSLALAFGALVVGGMLIEIASADGPMRSRAREVLFTPPQMVHPMDFPLMPGSPYGHAASNYHNPTLVHQPIYEHQYQQFDPHLHSYVPAPPPKKFRRHHAPAKPEVPVTLCFKHPQTGCDMEETVCVPACCALEAPTVSFRKPLLGIGLYTYEWCDCGHVVTIRICKHGKVTVRP